MKDLSPEEHLDIFLRAHRTVGQRLSQTFADAGAVPPSEARLLTVISRTLDHRMRIDALSQEMSMTKSAVSRIVDRLEREGFVQRETSSADRRAVYAVMTPEGRNALRHVTRVFRAAFKDVFLGSLSVAEMNLLSSLMERLDEANQGGREAPLAEAQAVR